MYEQLKQTFLDYLDHLIAMTPEMLVALVVLFIFIAIGHFLHKFLNRKFAIKWKQTIVSNFTANALKWFFYLIGIFAALDILNLGTVVSSLIAGAGITAIILGFAFKDIGKNLLAGVLLAINRPFSIGNIIEVDGFKGVVKGLDMRTTHIRNVEGKDIYIPNAMIIKNVLVNYTKDGLLRLEFDIGLDIPSNVEKAKELIMNFLAREPNILTNPAPNVITTEIGEFTINIKVLFWVDILKSKTASPSYLGITIRSKIIHEIKDLLLKNGFNLPSKILEHKTYEGPLEIELNKNQ